MIMEDNKGYTGKISGQPGILSAYIHFPFCVKKCPYCDFVSYAGCLDKKEAYIEALCREIIRTGQEKCGSQIKAGSDVSDSMLETIYMGGGTPSLFSPEQIAAVLRQLRDTFGIRNDAEITLEVNPGTVDKDAFSGYRAIGINRISIGVQSFSPALLSALGRIHSSEQAKNAIKWAKESGFTNISCDLMTGLAGQTIEDAQESLSVLLDNHIPHISFYALTLEEGTPFFEKYLNHEELLPAPELERGMYHEMILRLEKEGYIHYEISNCAKPGFESRHNSTYWRALPYYGFGCGAYSYTQAKRIGNTPDLTAYIDAMANPSADLSDIICETEEIDETENQKEYMLLGFRMMSGVSSDQFRRRYGLRMEDVFGGNLQRLISKGLILHEQDRYFLSDKGTDFANEVFREFVGK